MSGTRGMPADTRAKALRRRGPDEVLADHLARASAGDVEGDIAANFSPRVVILTGEGILRGHDGVRLSRLLWSGARPTRVRQPHRRVGPYAQVEWHMATPGAGLQGVDTYVIRDGWVVLHAMSVMLTGRPSDAPSVCRCHPGSLLAHRDRPTFGRPGSPATSPDRRAPGEAGGESGTRDTKDPGAGGAPGSDRRA